MGDGWRDKEYDSQSPIVPTGDAPAPRWARRNLVLLMLWTRRLNWIHCALVIFIGVTAGVTHWSADSERLAHDAVEVVAMAAIFVVYVLQKLWQRSGAPAGHVGRSGPAWGSHSRPGDSATGSGSPGCFSSLAPSSCRSPSCLR